MSRGTPEQVLKSIVDGINTGNLDALLSLYEPEAAFASQPGPPSRLNGCSRITGRLHRNEGPAGSQSEDFSSRMPRIFFGDV